MLDFFHWIGFISWFAYLIEILCHSYRDCVSVGFQYKNERYFEQMWGRAKSDEDRNLATFF